MGLASSEHGTREFGKPRLTVGDVVDRLELATIHGEPVPVPDPGSRIHLQFRRYAGCPICNLHLRSFARRHRELDAAGIRELAVFHSPAKDMLPHQADLPFAVIADPARELYRRFSVEISTRSLLHPRAWTTPLRPGSWSVVRRGRRAGGSPGPRSGESILGLPADFLIEPDGRLSAVKYGRHANDQWSVDELLQHADESITAKRGRGPS
jgi:peroxiredoxin